MLKIQYNYIYIYLIKIEIWAKIRKKFEKFHLCQKRFRLQKEGTIKRNFRIFLNEEIWESLLKKFFWT